MVSNQYLLTAIKTKRSADTRTESFLSGDKTLRDMEIRLFKPTKIRCVIVPHNYHVNIINTFS